MRCGPVLPILALLAGAWPALAQEWTGHESPNPIAQAVQPAAKAENSTKPDKKAAVHKPKVEEKTATHEKPKASEKTAAHEKPKADDKPAAHKKAKTDEKTAAKERKKETKKDTKQETKKEKKELSKVSGQKPDSSAAKLAAVKSVSLSEALAGVPAAERLKIQAALSWGGDYANIEKGEDPLVGAVKNFQKRVKAAVTGVLTSAQRDKLLAAAREHEDEFGWSVVTDPATGIRIGLPTKLVPNAHDAPRGTRWSSAHGDVQVETFRIKAAGLKLSALFEEEKHAHDRRVEYSVLHDDNFFISGTQGLKKFSVRATMRDGEVRGFTILFDQMMETIVEPVTVAMASAFAPFPERSAPFAALAKPVEYGTGLVVSAKGHIVTASRTTEGCQVIVVPGLGDADRIATDKSSGLALLRIYGRHKLSPLQLTDITAKTADLTLLGVPDPREHEGRKLTELKARLAGTTIELREPVPVAGFSGAAALDKEGHVLGMMDMRNAIVASTEPAAAPVRLISAATIRDFLTAHQVTPAAADGNAREAIVRVICVRK